MRKGVDNGFKTPDMKTLGVLQPRNYTTVNYALNTLKSLNLWTKKHETNLFGMQYQHCLMFQILHLKSHHLVKSKWDQSAQLLRKLLLKSLLKSYKICHQLLSKPMSVILHRKNRLKHKVQALRTNLWRKRQFTKLGTSSNNTLLINVQVVNNILKYKICHRVVLLHSMNLSGSGDTGTENVSHTLVLPSQALCKTLRQFSVPHMVVLCTKVNYSRPFAEWCKMM